MSTLTADNPQEQETFNSMAEALKNLPTETASDAEAPPATAPAAAPPQKPPDKPLAPPAAPPEENALESTKGMSPKAAEKFDHIKSERDKYKTLADQQTQEKKSIESQREELNKQISELRKTPQNIPELEGLRKERDQLNEILNVIRIEENPAFQQKWTSAVTKQIELAGAIVGPTLSVKTATILNMPDSPEKTHKLEELKAELSEDQIDELKDVRKNLRLIGIDRDIELKNSRSKYNELKEQENAVQSAKLKSIEKLFKDTGSKLADPKEGWAVFQKTDNVDWNRAVDERIADAEALFSGKLPAEKVAESAYKAAAFPAVLQFTSTLMKENTKLKEQIAGMSAANPRPGDPGKPAALNQKGEIAAAKDPQEALAAWSRGFIKDMGTDAG